MGVLVNHEPKKGVKEYPKIYKLIKPIVDKCMWEMNYILLINFSTFNF